MPVEINEIVITASVNEATSKGAASTVNTGNKQAAAEIIKTCVEEVLRILKEKEER